MNTIKQHPVSPHVTQFSVPTPTLPPAFETNSYLIQSGTEGILVDAGSRDEAVLDSLIEQVQASGVQRIRALAATHYHRDHTQGLPYLAERFDCNIFIHELDLEPASREMGIPRDTVHALPKSMDMSSVTIEFQHRPGHTHGHVHVLIPGDGVILVGDHLSGDGTVWIGPPDGHMDDYYAALRSIMDGECMVAGPGHGSALEDASMAARTLLDRRLRREAEIERRLATEWLSLDDLVHHVYGSTIPADAVWVAKKTIQAHLQRMLNVGVVTRRYDASATRFTYHTSG